MALYTYINGSIAGDCCKRRNRKTTGEVSTPHTWVQLDRTVQRITSKQPITSTPYTHIKLLYRRNILQLVITCIVELLHLLLVCS